MHDEQSGTDEVIELAANPLVDTAAFNLSVAVSNM